MMAQSPFMVAAGSGLLLHCYHGYRDAGNRIGLCGGSAGGCEKNPPGDIPDNQVFITYQSPHGFSVKVPVGCYTHFVSVASARSKTGAVVVSGSTLQQTLPTHAQQLLEASRTDRRLQLVVSIWADPIRTWPRLYRLLEELEAYLKLDVDVAGLCTKNERVRFNRSANCAEIAGKDARHMAGKFNPPSNPMNLSEATSFIGNLVKETLGRT